MKTLYLLRHAKASWDEPGISDADRPLLEKGIQRTGKLVRFLLEKELKPGLIVSSPTLRTTHTAQIIADGLGYDIHRIQVERKIYHGFYEDILDIIRAVPDDVSSVMIVGHNPSITELTNHFLDHDIDILPTSGLACFSFDTGEWKRIGQALAKKEFVVFPKHLK